MHETHRELHFNLKCLWCCHSPLQCDVLCETVYFKEAGQVADDLDCIAADCMNWIQARQHEVYLIGVFNCISFVTQMPLLCNSGNTIYSNTYIIVGMSM